MEDIVALGRAMGLEVTEEDICELVVGHDWELSTQELVELQAEAMEEQASLGEEEPGEEQLSTTKLKELLGLHQFEEVAVHSAEAGALRRGDNYEAVTWLSDSEVVRQPSPGWSARQFRVRPVQPSLVLQDGDVISLGDTQLTVMHMPGHSRGSICLHDKERKILFSGDVVYDGSMIDWLPYSRINDYVATCQRLIELVNRGLVEKVLPGHFNTFGAERLYHLASNYISNAGLCHKVSTCAMRSVASLALRATNSRTAS
nr:metallo-beta-lactamase domain-containing protein 2 [Pogona vitticeps]